MLLGEVVSPFLSDGFSCDVIGLRALNVALSWCLRCRHGSAQAEGPLFGRSVRLRALCYLPLSIPCEATFRGLDRPRVEALAHCGELQAFHLSNWKAFAASYGTRTRTVTKCLLLNALAVGVARIPQRGLHFGMYSSAGR